MVLGKGGKKLPGRLLIKGLTYSKRLQQLQSFLMFNSNKFLFLFVLSFQTSKLMVSKWTCMHLKWTQGHKNQGLLCKDLQQVHECCTVHNSAEQNISIYGVINIGKLFFHCRHSNIHCWRQGVCCKASSDGRSDYNHHIFPIEWFSTRCSKTKTNVVTVVSHKGRTQYSELIYQNSR